MWRHASLVCLILCLLFGLPLLGVVLAGKPVEPYLQFPPPTPYVEPAPFSWSMFLVLFCVVAGAVIPIAAMLLTHPKPAGVSLERARPLPWWGWLGLGGLALAWVLAWTRFSWFEPLQPYTFTPLWLGYIVTINAWTFKRTGHCTMLDRTGYFLLLFPVSSVFWWFFEYLNRFVHNWYYIGVSDFTAAQYVFHASLSFSTVLPAVLGTLAWLKSFPGLDRAFRDLLPLESARPTLTAWGVLGIASAGLTGVGLWSEYLFPLLWLAPLCIILPLQTLVGQETIFSSVRDGDWRPVCLPPLAGLICGFFWEMWNSQSLAHWEYAVPYVHRFEVFEMPLLGYAGYLPFGCECLAVASLLCRGALKPDDLV